MSYNLVKNVWTVITNGDDIGHSGNTVDSSMSDVDRIMVVPLHDSVVDQGYALPVSAYVVLDGVDHYGVAPCIFDWRAPATASITLYPSLPMSNLDGLTGNVTTLLFENVLFAVLWYNDREGFEQWIRPPWMRINLDSVKA